jgi:hypothetical protein
VSDLKIVAFMLSPSRAVDLDISLYAQDQEYHRMVMRQSMSGRRLAQAFGDMFDQIHWDNVNPMSGAVDADMSHVKKIIKNIQPDLIIGIGGVARKAVHLIDPDAFSCHHPNARYRTQDDLNAFAHRVRCWVHARTTNNGLL